MPNTTSTPAQGSKFEFHDGTSYVEVNNVLSYDFNPVKSRRQITSLADNAVKEKNNLPDYGTFDLNLNIDRADPGQAAMIVADDLDVERSFKLTQSDGYVAVFPVLPAPIAGSGAGDGDVNQTVSLKVNAKPAWTAP